MFPVIFYFTMWYFLTLYQGWGTQQFPKGRSHLLFACPSSKGPEKRSKACKFVLYWNHNRIIWRKYHLLSKVIPPSKISHILHFPIDTFCYSHLWFIRIQRLVLLVLKQGTFSKLTQCEDSNDLLCWQNISLLRRPKGRTSLRWCPLGLCTHRVQMSPDPCWLW